MGSKLSGTALQRMALLEEARRKWDRVRSLVEQAATQPGTRDSLLPQCRRAAEEVARIFSDAGFGALSDSGSQLAQLVGRGRNFEKRVGGARDLVGTVHAGIDRAKLALQKNTD